MIERFLHVLVALAVVIVTVMPGHVQAMPMPSDMTGMGQHEPCQNCPEPSPSGNDQPRQDAGLPLTRLREHLSDVANPSRPARTRYIPRDLSSAGGHSLD